MVIPCNRIHSAPMIDRSVLKQGVIGTLLDFQKSAADHIRIMLNNHTISVILSEVPVENTVEQWGAITTDEVMNKSLSIIEDKELLVKRL